MYTLRKINMTETISLTPEMHDLQLEILRRAIERAHSVTLEVGTGAHSLERAPDGTPFDDENLYIGLNIDSRQHLVLADDLERRGSGFAVLNRRDELRPIDVFIPPNSVDTVVMANVFGEPDSKNTMHNFKDRQGVYRGHTDTNAKIQTLSEVLQALKPNGHLVVVETYTPYKGSWKTDGAEDMVKIISDQGFKVEEIIRSTDVRWGEATSLVSKYTDDSYVTGREYMIVASKHPGELESPLSY